MHASLVNLSNRSSLLRKMNKFEEKNLFYEHACVVTCTDFILFSFLEAS